MSSVLDLVIADTIREYNNQRGLAERAIAQISDDEFFRTLDGEANSIAIIMKHVGGNLKSRWRDFLSTDGEKPDRNRDGEFETGQETRDVVLRVWNDGFAQLEASLQSLTPADLERDIMIRGESLSVVQAIHRNLAHTAHHVGQIVMLAKHWRGPDWQTLSIPRKR